MWLMRAAKTGIYIYGHDYAAIIPGTVVDLLAYSQAYKLDMPVSSTYAI
jgi:hypothetical protein